jgi:hypothetical protein
MCDEFESAAVLEERFTGTVEEVQINQLRLRLTTSGGEEVTTWLPLNRVSTDENNCIRVGAVVCIEIVRVMRNGTIRREYRIHFPCLTKVSAETREHMTDWLTNQMEQLIARSTDRNQS